MLQFDVHSQCCFLTNTQPSSTGAAPRNQFKKAFLLGDFKEREERKKMANILVIGQFFRCQTLTCKSTICSHQVDSFQANCACLLQSQLR